MKNIFSDGFHSAIRKIKLIFHDHFRLLFKSSTDNHLHLQKCQKDTSGKIVCSVSFSSCSALKSYQKKFRTVTISLSSTVAMVLIAAIVSPLIFNPSKSDAAQYVWMQSSWDASATPGSEITKNGTENEQTTYESKGEIDTSVGTEIKLASQNENVVQTNDGSTSTGFNLSGSFFDQTQVSGSGDAAKIVLAQAGFSTETKIAGGDRHSLALKTDGTVWAWGRNSEGQLGDGTTTNRTTPVQVSTLSGVSAIYTKEDHSLALKSDGTVWAWGRNANGQLGDGTTTQRTTPVQVSTLSGVSALAVGYGHSLALKTDGTVWAWGDNGSGQLGDGMTTQMTTPVQVSSLSGVSAIAAAQQHSLALKTDGTVWAWGNNGFGQLGDGTTTQRNTPVQVSSLSGVSAIAAGSAHSLALKTDGTVWAWGRNDIYQLGDGTTTQRTTPVQVSSLSGVSTLVAGGYHSLAIKTDGTVWAWGHGVYGQLGNGTTTDTPTLVQVSSLSGVSTIAAGYGHSLALKIDGTVWAWGWNDIGQLGDGTLTNRSTPVQTKVLGGATKIVGGDYHSLALKDNGTVWAWGYNSYGQLGDGTTTNRSTPVNVSSLSGVSAISAGDFYSLALKTDGTVWAWGWNGNGQLGDSTTTDRSTPVQVSSLSGVSAISAGDYHSLALKSDGTVWAWGYNDNGQLGDSTTTDRSTPVQVSSLSGVSAISARDYHSLALKSDGTVWAWGRNNQGQLGDSTTTDRSTPVQVSSLSGVSAIAAGSAHSLALKSDGTVWAWGRNANGQLGDGTTTNRSTPVNVSSLSGVSTLVAGGYHSLAIKTDGTVWAWGYNGIGQLGDGTLIDKSTPVSTQIYIFINLTGTATYYSNGFYVSGSIDTGQSSASLGNLAWTNSSGQTITIKIRSDADGNFSDATDWGSCSNISNGSALSTGNCVTNGHRYLQYKASLSTSDTTKTPSLNDITLNFSYYPTSPQSLVSSAFDSTDKYTAINNLTWSGINDATGSQGTIKFQMRVASSQANLASAQWCGPTSCNATLGTADFYTTKAGSTINNTQSDHADNRWIQYATFLNSFDGSQTPVIQDVTINFAYNNPPTVAVTGASQQSDGTIKVDYTMAETATEQTEAYPALFYQANNITLSADTTATGTENIQLVHPAGTAIPTLGKVLIDKELISYTGISTVDATHTNLTGITRSIAFVSGGNYLTEAVLHSAGAEIYFRATNVSGNIDSSIATGVTTRTAYWDAKSEANITLNGTNWSNVKIKVAANDNDAYGNRVGSDEFDSAITTDFEAPTISSVTSSVADGKYTVGTTIPVTINFSEAVTSSGQVNVTLETGDNDYVCAISSVTNSSSASCDYVVQAGDFTADLGATQISGTISDQFSNAMINFEIPAGQNISDSKDIVIDTLAPDLSDVAPITNAFIKDISSTSSTISFTANETLSSGTITFTRTSGADDNNSPHLCTLQGTALNQGVHSNFQLVQGANNCEQAQTNLVSGTIYTMEITIEDNAGTAGTYMMTTTDNTSNVTSIDQDGGFGNGSFSSTEQNGTSGDGASVLLSQVSCGQTVDHGGITYQTVLANDGKCWLKSNLGTATVATSYNHSAAYGWLFQWGRNSDGHQITTSGTTTTLSSSDTPGHTNFITSGSSPYDWRSPQNGNLWQGVSGINNPCPSGWRLPTQPEWSAVVTAEGITNYTTAASSNLKLTAAGYRDRTDGSMSPVGSFGYYWSSSPNGPYAFNLNFYSSSVYPANYLNRAYGFSVRCLKNSLETAYLSSGTYTSYIDGGENDVVWGSLSFDGTFPTSGQTLAFKIVGTNDTNTPSSADFDNAACSIDATSTDGTYAFTDTCATSLAEKRYLWQRASFATSDTSKTPTLDSVTATADIFDPTGNATTVSATNITFDTTDPTITITAPTNSEKFNNITDASDFSYTVDNGPFNENLQSAKITFTRTGGAADASSPRVCNLSGTELQNGTHSSVNLNEKCGSFDLVSSAIYSIDIEATDQAGNTGNATQITAAEFDNVAPVLTRFDSDTADPVGAYGTGQEISIKAVYDENVAIGSTLTVRLDNAATPAIDITLNQISGNEISGTYTVQGPNLGHDTGDLNIASIISQNVTDTVNNTQSGSSIPSGENLADNKQLVIDTGPPVLDAFSAPEGKYKAGTSFTVTADYSEMLSTLNGGSSINVTFNSGKTLTLSVISSDKLTGTYTVEAGESVGSLQVTTINSQNAVDSIGNPLITTDLPSSNISGVQIDTTAPTISITAPTNSEKFNNITDASDFSYEIDNSPFNEDLASAKITFTRTGGSADASSPRVCNLSGTELQNGEHSNVNLNEKCGGFDLISSAIYSIDIEATDQAGNTGSGAQITLAEFDNVAPVGYSVVFDQNYVNSDNDESVSFSFAGAEVGASYTYSIDDNDGGTASITGFGTISTATDQIFGINVAGLSDGELNLTVQLTDVVGNQGADAVDSVIKDTAAPIITAVSVSNEYFSPNASSGSKDTTNINYELNENHTVNLKIYSGTDSLVRTLKSEVVESSGAKIVAWNGKDDSNNFVSNGTYTFKIDAADVAANHALQQVATVVVDNTAPTISQDLFATNNPFSPNGDSQKDTTDFKFISSDSGSYAIVVTEDGGAKTATLSGFMTASQSTTHTWDGKNGASISFSNGSHSAVLTLTDFAGNSISANAYIIATDGQVSAVLFDDGVEAGPVTDDSISISVNVADAVESSFKYIFSSDTECSSKSDGEYVAGSTFVSSESFSINNESNNGKYICARALDGAGTKFYASSLNRLNIDVSAPQNGSFAINSSAERTNSTNVTLNVVCPTDSWAAVQVAFGNSADPTNWTDCAATKSHILDEGDGEKTVYVRFSDGGGNTTDNLIRSIELDTSAPTGGSFTINNDAAFTGSVDVTLNLTCPTDSWAAVQVAFGNSADPTNWTNCAATKSHTLENGNGEKTVYVRFSDGGGNITDNLTKNITLDTTASDNEAPVLESINIVQTAGIYGPGGVIDFTAQYDEDISSGNLVIGLSNGVQLTLDVLNGRTLSKTYAVGSTGSGEDTASLAIASIISESVIDTSVLQNERTNSNVPPTNISGIVIDTTAPQDGSVIIDRSKDSGQITISASDAASSTENMQAEIISSENENDACSFVGNWVSYTENTDMTSDSVKKACVRFKDLVGNISLTYSATAPEDPQGVSYTDITNLNISPQFKGVDINWIKPVQEGSGGFSKYDLKYCLVDKNAADCQATGSLVSITDVNGNYYLHKNLDESKKYCYSLRFGDNEGNYSKYSDRSCVIPGEGAVITDSDVDIRDISIGSITNTQAQLSFRTINTANSDAESATNAQVFLYSNEGMTEAVGSAYTETDYSSSHIVKFSGLSPSNSYYIKIIATDTSIITNPNRSQEVSYNASIYPELTFATTGVLSSVTLISDDVTTKDKAVIEIRTDQEAKCYIEYKRLVDASNEGTTTVETEFRKSHAITISNILFADTAYKYDITCFDADDTFAYLNDQEFKTSDKAFSQGDVDAANISDSTAPEISSVVISEITGETAVVKWNTNEKTNSLVAYSLDGSDYNKIAGDVLVLTDSADYSITHIVTINDLIPASKYAFSVISSDISGNIAQSSQSTFTTKEPSSLSSVKVQSKALNQATITWETGKETTSVVEYGLTTSYGETKQSNTRTKVHELTISALQSGKTYHFRVKGEDADGNLFASNDNTFEPKSPPKISDFKVDEITEHEAKITFITNVPTDTLVEYTDAGDEDNSGTQGKPDFATKHEIVLKNLASGKEFGIKLKVRDEDGNETEEVFQNFTTSTDENPPKIEQVRTDSALAQNDKVQAIISWKTDENSDTRLVYKEGKSGKEIEVNVSDVMTTAHIAVITTFKSGTVYYFNAISRDTVGNEARSGDFALLTPKRRENIVQIIVNNFQDIFGWAKR